MALQALGLSDLIPWICLLLPLSHREGLIQVTPEWTSAFTCFLHLLPDHR